MKSNYNKALLLSLATCVVLSACNKKSETVTETPTPEGTPAVEAVAKGLEAVAADVKEMAKPVEQAGKGAQVEAEKAKETVTEVLSDGKKNAMEVFESVKELIAQAKYTEALAAISELSIDRLSPDLQQMANKLKEQAETALASTAAGKAGETINNVLEENNIKLENPFKK